MSGHGDGPTDRDVQRGPRRVQRRAPLLRACEAAGVAGPRPALGRAAADPGGEGLAATACTPKRHVAFRPHAAAAGGHARVRHVLAAAQHRARSRGEALLLHDGAGRVPPHRSVAEARRRGGRHRRAGSAPRQPRAHDARGGHGRGEGLPHAGLLRAPDHLAVPPHCPLVARHGPRGPLQPPRDGRRHPSRRGHGVRARAAAGLGQEDEPHSSSRPPTGCFRSSPRTRSGGRRSAPGSVARWSRATSSA